MLRATVMLREGGWEAQASVGPGAESGGGVAGGSSGDGGGAGCLGATSLMPRSAGPGGGDGPWGSQGAGDQRRG